MLQLVIFFLTLVLILVLTLPTQESTIDSWCGIKVYSSYFWL